MSQELIKKFRAGEFVSCSNFHYGSCEFKACHRMLRMMKTFAMFYGPAHVLPVLIFKLKQLKRDPVNILKHLIESIIRSVCFGCSTIGVTQYGLCIFNKIFKKTTRLNWLFISTLSSASIFIEASSRRGELALYLLPKAMESIWNIMKKYGFPLRIKYFEVFLFGIAMGTLAYFLHNDEQHIKPTYRSSLRLFYGNN